MRNSRFWTWMVMVAVALGTVGASLAQDPKPKGKMARPARGKGHLKGAGPQKAQPKFVDPLANAQAKGGTLSPLGMYHFKMRITVFDGTPLAATYYPARLGTTAPVILMVHQKDRSGKDFEETIGELKNVGLAEHFQGLGYAVLIVDLRGHGANQRRPLKPEDWQMMIADLQAAYQFLVDRHNQGELNVAKLGVLGVGEGANVVAAWAAQPGGAVSSEGRISDIDALVLVSPLANLEGTPLGSVLASIGPRIPIQILVGERDAASKDAVKSVKQLVQRSRTNRVEVFPSSLHAYKLLRLEPKVTSVIARFFEGMVKFKAAEWEGRWNQRLPITDVERIYNTKLSDAAAKERAKEKKVAPANPPKAAAPAANKAAPN